MNKQLLLIGCWLAACSLLACSHDVATGRRCASGDSACPASPRTNGGTAAHSASGAAGGSGTLGSGGSSSGAVGSSDNALTVHVEDNREMTIEIVTLACAGDCADIEAVAHGGNPPYEFAWEDGSTSASRHVCLDANQQLGVSTTDTAIESDEFSYDAQTAHAEVSAKVLDCSDDAGTPVDTSCVFENPSFEGTPMPNVSGSEFDAPPWQACDLTPDISGKEDSSGTGELPSDGDTYLYLGVATFLGSESIGEKLCSPLRAGETRSLLIDVRPFVPVAGAALQFYGSSTDACSEDELLGETETITNTDAWTKTCVTLRSSADRAFVKIKMNPELGGGMVDDIVPVDACP